MAEYAHDNGLDRALAKKNAEVQRLRAQVAAADKLAETIGRLLEWYEDDERIGEPKTDGIKRLHAAYLASRAPESPHPTASGFPDP